MPIRIPDGQSSICIRKQAFEAAGMTRAAIDDALSLTSDEFALEQDLIVVGPLFGANATRLLEMLESAGLEYFDDYVEMSGNWPAWLQVFAMHRT